MKKIFAITAAAGMLMAFASACSDDDYSTTWEQYKEWREENSEWLQAKTDSIDPATGEKYFVRIDAPWNSNRYVLMHWFNDRSSTAGNLTPLYTSTVGTTYIGHLKNDVAFDSSYTQVDSIATFQLNGLIEGWQIALSFMHVYDTVEIIVPFTSAYGANSSTLVPPYSNLRFNMKLRSVEHLATRP